LKTYNFSFGRPPSKRIARDKKFYFGETIPLKNFADLLISIEELLDRSRNIVLGGHNLPSDFQVLRSIGFDLSTSIVGYTDTADAACAILNTPSGQAESSVTSGFRLRNLLLKLGLVVYRCHIGGNDANFTLRALLLLAIEAFDRSGSSNEPVMEILEKIKSIALDPIPSPLSPPAAKKTKTVIMEDRQTRGADRVYFGHLTEISRTPQEPTEKRKNQQPDSCLSLKYAGSCQSQSPDFQQPSDLLLQWCPKFRNSMGR
jgi:hypothetical protein